MALLYILLFGKSERFSGFRTPRSIGRNVKRKHFGIYPT
jgi:hypothetical protein